MIVLDTDTLTLYFRNHPQVRERHRQAEDDVVITIFSKIEVLQGPFATLLKAANGAELQRGQQRLDEAERDLSSFSVVPITNAAATEFDRLLENKKLKKVGRADL